MSRDISSSDDMIDVRDVIERFEELESERKPWRAGWNMPGYMPDSEPAGFASFEDAREYIVSALADVAEAYQDKMDDWQENADVEASIERWKAIDNECDQGETVGKYHYWIAKVDGAEAFDSEEDADEYAKLAALLEDLKGYGGDEQWRGDWYPLTLINEDHFVKYCEELCEDIGDIPRELPDYIVIDWQATARNLKVDYSEVEFDGVTFFYR